MVTPRYFDGYIEREATQMGDPRRGYILRTEAEVEPDSFGKQFRLELVPAPGPMVPGSLSASAALKFELCAAGYRADYIDRVPQLGGTAGLLGNALHEALQFWVESGQYLKFKDEPLPVRQKAMAVVWEMSYWNYFHDKSKYALGWEMLLKFVQREDWDNRTVLETEVKKSFLLPTSKGDLPVNYILDRKDRTPQGEIEVVDYKSVARPIQPEEMKGRIQPRLYALAMFIEHKDENPERVWVTYDLLRYDRVTVCFTRAESIETWNYLKALAERIYLSDGTLETLNPECRFCSRATVCETLRRHEQYSGPVGVPSLEEATDRLAMLENARGGLDAAIEQMSAMALEFAEQENVFEWDTNLVEAKVTAKGRREVNSERIAQIVGPEVMGRYGKLNVGIVERILEEEQLTDSQKSQIKQLITKTFGKAYVQVKPKSHIED